MSSVNGAGRATAAVPLVVIGGYLGAGKTTLVNHLLRHAQGRRIAVLVNDFGSVSIDADLIVGASAGVLALAGGCVCCSYGADLIGTLERTAADARGSAPDVMLLECSGVGLPAAVARGATLARGVAVEGIAVVVDASQVRQQAQDRYVGDTVGQQLHDADLLVLNQTDRCDEASLVLLQGWLQACCPATPQVRSAHGELPPELVLGLNPLATAPEGSGTAELWASRPIASAVSRFRHFEHPVLGPVDPQAMARELLAAEPGLLRAKGIVHGLDGRLWSVQVMGRRVEVVAHVGAPAATGLLVCIAGRTMTAAS